MADHGVKKLFFLYENINIRDFDPKKNVVSFTKCRNRVNLKRYRYISIVISNIGQSSKQM